MAEPRTSPRGPSARCPPARAAVIGDGPTGLRSTSDTIDRLPPPPPGEVPSLGLCRSRTQVLAGQPAPIGCPPGVPGYEILGELGQGGMGVVYKARQIGLNRLVCLKLIRGGPHAEPEVLARFTIEAQALARMNHPNIVQIYEIGEVEGGPYLSLEFVDGPNLAQRLRDTRLAAREAARLVEILARALHEVHRHDIVHRDLKPSNILLSAVPPSSGNTFSTPKVTDFGLAKQLGVQAGPTKKGAILGTPIYMAPEQARGGTDGIGAAADIYALGAVLYELLSARPPFQAKTMWETLQQVRCAEPVPPSQLQPDVPGGLEAICLRCLRKQPHDRYPSAEALADELARFLAARAV